MMMQLYIVNPIDADLIAGDSVLCTEGKNSREEHILAKDGLLHLLFEIMVGENTDDDGFA